MTIDGVKVTADFDAKYDELVAYVSFIKEQVPEADSIEVKQCGKDMVDVSYTVHGEKFERIRRITGYLVGTMEKWNDSKQAEEHDRIKHVGNCCNE